MLDTHIVRSGAILKFKPASRLPTITAARRALSSKLSVTDGDVAVEIANDHPKSTRRDRTRLPGSASAALVQPTFQHPATRGEPSDGTLNAAIADGPVQPACRILIRRGTCSESQLATLGDVGQHHGTRTRRGCGLISFTDPRIRAQIRSICCAARSRRAMPVMAGKCGSSTAVAPGRRISDP